MNRVLAALTGLALLFGAEIALGADAAKPAVPAGTVTVSTATPAAALPAEEPAVAPDAFVERAFLAQLTDGTFLAKVLGVLGGLLIILRGLAEGLTRLSNYTDATWDNKAAAWLSEATWVLGSFLGKLGYGTPKPVLAEHVAQATAPVATDAKNG